MGFDRAPREEHEVTCAECGTQTTVPFKPTGERPVLCRDCFSKNRPPRTGGDRPRGGSSYGGGGGGGGGSRFSDRPPRDMHDATCSRCGKATQVPFRPTPGRDVFCRDCFQR